MWADWILIKSNQSKPRWAVRFQRNIGGPIMEALSKKILISTSLALVLLASCVTNGKPEQFSTPSSGESSSAHEDCVNVELHKLLEDPKSFDGSYICTSGFIHDRGSAVLHPKRDPTRQEYYGTALMLDFSECDSCDFLESVQLETFVFVKGKVDVSNLCWTPARDDEIVECVPFARPIDLFVMAISGQPDT